MAATFSNFLATATDMAQVVAQEPTGFLDAIDIRGDVTGAILNQPVHIGNVSPVTASAWTPGVKTTLPTGTDTGAQLTLNQAREAQFDISGEQLNGLNLGNQLAQTWLQTKMQEAMRTLRNEVEVFLAGVAKVGASRVVGTAGTTPFASNLDLTAELRQILIENGGPKVGWSLVVNPAAGTNARKLLGSVVAAAGSQAAALQIAGDLPVHNGFQFRESTGIALHTAGTGSGYLVNAASTPAASTAIIADTGTGTLLAGDTVSFAADTANAGGYVVSTALTGGTFSINRPGVRIAIPDNNAITRGGSYTPNIGLHRGAIVAVVRPPSQAEAGINGGQPFMTSAIADPMGKFAYGMYAQQYDGGILISLRCIYGAMAANPHLIATLRG